MMLATETELVDQLKQSQLGRLCKVDVLPALNESVLDALLRAAPAMYVSLRGARINGDLMQLDLSIWVLAKSYRAYRAGRQGDALTPGLYELAEAVLATLFTMPGYLPLGFRADSGDYVDKYGIYSGEITLSTTVDVPVDEAALAATLAPFATFHADYDISPMTPNAHAGWVAEPPVTTPDAPDASDTVSLPQ